MEKVRPVPGQPAGHSRAPCPSPWDPLRPREGVFTAHWTWLGCTQQDLREQPLGVGRGRSGGPRALSMEMLKAGRPWEGQGHLGPITCPALGVSAPPLQGRPHLWGLGCCDSHRMDRMLGQRAAGLCAGLLDIQADQGCPCLDLPSCF